MKQSPPNMSVVEAPRGHVNDISVYRKGRKCKLCKCRLGIYTPGPYCLAHGFKGVLIEIDKEAARVERINAKYRAMMRDKKKKGEVR